MTSEHHPAEENLSLSQLSGDARRRAGGPQGGLPAQSPPQGAPNPVYQAYQAERNALLSAAEGLAKSYDTWLLTLSGGAFGLSMTFLKDIVAPNVPSATGYLLLSWLLLASAMLLIMVGMRLSETAHRQYISIRDEVYRQSKRPFWESVREAEAKCWRPKCVKVLNLFSLIFFVLGLFSMSYFAYANL